MLIGCCFMGKLFLVPGMLIICTSLVTTVQTIPLLVNEKYKECKQIVNETGDCG